jgi:choline dehydrogenase-like flavoprotein
MTRHTGETLHMYLPAGHLFNTRVLVNLDLKAKDELVATNKMAIVPQINALREIPGVEFPPDSGAGRTGVDWFPTFMDPKTVKRSYARTGHYDGIRRTNYELVVDSRVTRTLLDDGTATGVTFKQTRLNVTSNYTIKANREVIFGSGRNSYSAVASA